MLGGVMSRWRVLQKWRHWLRRHIISDVSPEDGYCEFGCRKQECRFDHWVNCKNRLVYLDVAAASGEQATMKSEVAAQAEGSSQRNMGE